MTNESFEAFYDDVPPVDEEKSTPADKKSEDIDAIRTNVEESDEPKKEPVSLKPKKENPTPSEAMEEAARAQGWVPFEEWDGDPAQWRDADVFLERGEYFTKISSQNKQIKKLNRELDEMSKQFSKIREDERKKVLDELKREKARAIEDEEYNRVVEIDEEIDKTNREAEEEKRSAEEASKEDHEAMMREFVEQNEWYAKDPTMKAYADRIAAGYAAVEGTNDVQEILDYVVDEVKHRFSDSQYFTSGAYEEEHRGRKSSPVGSSSASSNPSQSRRSGSNKTAKAKDLNDIQRQVGQRFVDMGEVGSLDEYAAELQKVGGLD